jgi:hypothetical protein
MQSTFGSEVIGPDRPRQLYGALQQNTAHDPGDRLPGSIAQGAIRPGSLSTVRITCRLPNIICANSRDDRISIVGAVEAWGCLTLLRLLAAAGTGKLALNAA